MVGREETVQKFREYELSDISDLITARRIILFLVITGFLINSYLALTLSIWNDEAITANAATSLAEDGVPDFKSGYEYWRALPFTLIVAASTIVFGVSDFSLRFPSVVFGALTIGLTYILSKELFDRESALIGAGFLTFSALQTAWASQVRMYAMLQFLYILTVFLIYKLLKQKEKKYLIPLILSLITVSFVHVTGQILFLVALSYWAYLNDLHSIMKDRLMIVFPVGILIVLIVFELYFNLDFLEIFERLTFNPENARYYYELVFRNIPALSILGVIGSYIGFREKKDSGILMILSCLPALYIYIFHYQGIADRYIYFSLPFLAIWTGLTIRKISEKTYELLEKLEVEIPVKVVIILTTLIALIAGSGFDYDYTDDAYRPNMDEKSVYDRIERNWTNDDILITQWTPSATYYLQAPDYSLYGDTRFRGFNSTPVRKDYNFSGQELYSGAGFLDNNNELLNVVTNNERGWVVLRDDTYWRKSEQIKQTLSDIYKVGEFNRMNLWKWNQSFTSTTNASLLQEDQE